MSESLAERAVCIEAWRLTLPEIAAGLVMTAWRSVGSLLVVSFLPGVVVVSWRLLMASW